MISKIDKVIINILLHICSILSEYSKTIPSFKIYGISKEIENLSCVIEEDKQVEVQDGN